MPQPILQHQAERPFALDKELFLKNLKRARRGAAAGPSGVTTEHLKPVLNDSRDAERLFSVGLLLAQANIPQEILTALRMGRVTALQKPNGSVRGIVASDVFRSSPRHPGAHRSGPTATVVSIDGISAFDVVSRRAMLEGLQTVAAVLWFRVFLLVGRPGRHSAHHLASRGRRARRSPHASSFLPRPAPSTLGSAGPASRRGAPFRLLG